MATDRQLFCHQMPTLCLVIDLNRNQDPTQRYMLRYVILRFNNIFKGKNMEELFGHATTKEISGMSGVTQLRTILQHVGCIQSLGVGL